MNNIRFTDVTPDQLIQEIRYGSADSPITKKEWMVKNIDENQEEPTGNLESTENITKRYKSIEDWYHSAIYPIATIVNGQIVMIVP